MPSPLASRLRCVVLGADADVVRIAVSSEADPETAALVAVLTGRRVEVIEASEAAVARALLIAERRGGAVPMDRRDAPPLGAFLVRAGLVSDAHVRQALAEQARTGERLGRLLVRAGALSHEALAGALSIRLDLPLIRLDQWRPPRETVHLLPEDVCRSDRVLPVRRQGDTLHVAVAADADVELLDRIEALTGLHPRPLLATDDALDAALQRAFRAAQRSVPAPVQAVLDRLAAAGTLDRHAVVRAQAEYEAGLGLDEALQAGGGVAPERVATLLADAAGLAARTLWPSERLVSVIDALGVPGMRHEYIDPVDPAVARYLPAGLAEQAAALPVAVEGDAIVVAVADPLDTASLESARGALPGPARFVVATREEIRAATRRTVGRRQLGDYLLEAGLVSRDELDRALRLARDTNVRIGKALLTLGYVSQDQITQRLAEAFDLPYFDLSAIALDDEVARMVPEELSRRSGVLPLAVDERGALVAVVDPTDEAALRATAEALGRPVTAVITTERQMEAALESIYRDEYVQRASTELLSRSPDDSAAQVWTRAQLAWIGGIFAAVLAGLALAPIATMTALVGLSTAFYFTLSVYKLLLINRSLTGTLEETITPDEVAALDERDLPIYTVLVPVYKEANVLPVLVEGLSRLDYPSTKLDVILLLEEDDRETRDAVAAMRLPEGFRALVVPFMRPKTKPKACNYGLLKALGEFLVIYDAEDVPEPDQLKKAVAIFRRYDERLICIQSKLNYFNRDQNLLTRWFTIEYSTWFDLLLPGLDRTDAPLPLGGTSNHFRTHLLRGLGGWDPFNTTEDADLGLRIFKRGFRTVVMNSTTYEEANSNLYNWIRQRSRWIKGYMQTWLVHMRHPVRLYREIGFKAFFSFQMIVAGTWFTLLANPFFWLVTMLWFVFQWDVIQRIFPGPIFYVGAVGLYAGNFAFVYIHVAGALRREYYHLVKYALLIPIYWSLMSVAAWQALRELIFKPHYWQKTNHGLFKGKARVPGPRRGRRCSSSRWR